MNDTLKECPFCGVLLVKTGGPENWEWVHADPAGEGCLLEGVICLQDADDIAAWNARKSPRTDMGDDLERLIEEQDARNQSTGRVNCVHVPIRQARAILTALRTGEATDV